MEIIVALITALGVVGAASVPNWRFQRKVHRENRDDHAANAAASRQQYAAIGEKLTELAGESRDTRADLREFKTDFRSHLNELGDDLIAVADRVTAIETPAPQEDQ